MIFNGTQGQAKLFGYLFFGQIIDITHSEHFAATRRKAVDSLIYDISQIRIENTCNHRIIVRGIIAVDQGGYAFFIFIAIIFGKSAFSQIVKASVIHGPDKIALKITAVIFKLFPILPDTEKDILHDIIGPRIGKEQAGIGNEGGIAFNTKSIESLSIPVPDTVYQFSSRSRNLLLFRNYKMKFIQLGVVYDRRCIGHDIFSLIILRESYIVPNRIAASE